MQPVPASQGHCAVSSEEAQDSEKGVGLASQPSLPTRRVTWGTSLAISEPFKGCYED